MVCVFLNVLCVVTGGILGADQWFHKQMLVERSQDMFLDLQRIESTRTFSLNLMDKPVLRKGSKNYEAQLYQRWSERKTLVDQIDALKSRDILNAENYDIAATKDIRGMELRRLYTDLSAASLKKISSLQEMQAKITNYHWQLFAVAVLTLIFGIVLPVLLFGLLTKLLNKARIEMQKQVKEWIDGWVDGTRKEGAFKDPQFWVNMSLLSIELVARYYKHPIAEVGGDISKLIRQELEKANQPTPTQKPTAA